MVRDSLAAGTTVQYASSASSTATVGAGMKMSAPECFQAVAVMKTAKAQAPADGKYFAFIHPYTELNLAQYKPSLNIAEA